MDKTWRERIAEAEARGAFTSDDIALAQNFNTCAVGEQRAVGMPFAVRMHNAYEAVPLDDTLYDHGYQFYRAVRDGLMADAARHLGVIEDRALAIKRAGGTDLA